MRVSLFFLLIISLSAFADDNQWQIVQGNFVLKKKKWIGPELKVNNKFPFKVCFEHVEPQHIVKINIDGNNRKLLLPNLKFGAEVDSSLNYKSEEKNLYIRCRYWLEGTLSKNRNSNLYKLSNHKVLLDRVSYEKRKSTNSNTRVYSFSNGREEYGTVYQFENYTFTGNVFTFLRGSSPNMKFSYFVTIKAQRRNAFIGIIRLSQNTRFI